MDLNVVVSTDHVFYFVVTFVEKIISSNQK